MNKIKLSQEQARQFLLIHQRLLSPQGLKGKDGALEFIKRVGCIQFDPLNKVGQNPDLVLQSRVKNYKQEFLRELLYKDRKLLDGWDKNMSIYSTEDWPYLDRYRKRALSRYEEKFKNDNDILSEIRTTISERGPISSLELKFDHKVDWAWAPTRLARAALEGMNFWGELVIHHRVGTRKYYDFTSKHLSSDLLSTPDPNNTMKEYHKWHVKRRIGGIGLLWGRAGDGWLGIRELKSKERSLALTELEKRDEIKKIEVKDINYPFYIRKEELSILDKVLDGVDFEPRVSFIAPLDNLIWDRKIIESLFNFKYVWEVYKPAAERLYGYYVLPILYGDKFIGRFEPIVDKKNKRLVIENLWWEPDVVITKEIKSSLNSALNEFCSYLGLIDYDLNQVKL